MADLPGAKAPRDLHHPRANLNIARAEIGIAEQQIVLDGKSLQLIEIGEEEDRINADLLTLRAEAVRLDEAAAAIEKKEGASTAGAYRAKIKSRQQHLLIQQRSLRLLELEDERDGIAIDIAASRAHIATLEAEISQQTTRLNEESHG